MNNNIIVELLFLIIIVYILCYSISCPSDNTIILIVILSIGYILYRNKMNYVENFSRKSDYRKYLNNSIGRTGQFYVDCSDRVGKCCDKKSLRSLDILEDNKYSSCPLKVKLDHDVRFNDFYLNKVRCNKNNRNIVKDQIKNHVSQLSMPDYKDGYDYRNVKFNPLNNVDTNHIFCYNCLLDNETKRFFRNFDNFPQTNGPPQTNEFSH